MTAAAAKDSDVRIEGADALTAFTEVVVPLDGSRRGERALPTATALASQAGATLRLVLVAPDAHMETYLEKVAASLDLASETEVIVDSDPAARIAELEHARRDRSVVVMASHAHTRPAEFLLGSTANDVVRARPGPVVVVGPHCRISGERFSTLVVPITGSEHSEAILPLAASWARALRLKVVLLSVGALFPWPPSEPDNYHLRQLAYELWREGVDSHVVTTEDGNAADGILGYVKRAEQPLVAMATHAHAGSPAVSPASVAMTVARWSIAPVTLLRPLD